MISVVIPFKNAELFLAECLDSVISQDEVEFEVILVNDSSSDNSLEIASKYIATNSNLKLFESPGVGLVDALNFGIQNSRGSYIARLDADDQMVAGRLRIQCAFLNENLDVAVVGSQVSFFDEFGFSSGKISHYPVGRSELSSRITEGCFLAHPSVMFRKSLVEELGGYRSQFRHAEDYDLWLRVSELSSLDNIDVPLTMYRQHPNQISVRKRNEQELSTRAAQLSQMIRKGNIKGFQDSPETYEDLPAWVDDVEVEIKKIRPIKYFFESRSKRAMFIWSKAAAQSSFLRRLAYLILSFWLSPKMTLINLKFFVFSRVGIRK